MKKKFRTFQASLVLLILSITPLSFAETALDFSSLGGGSDYYGGSYSLGWRFTANSNLRVTALGFYDDLQNGVATYHPVGIYDQVTCELLTETNVLGSDPLEGYFRFRDITPIILEAGKEYYIATVNGYDKYATNVTTINVNPAITYWGFAQYGVFQSSQSTLECPNGQGTANYHGNYGPTFKFVNLGGTAKRASAIQLFCNRTGSNLETAKCSVTVADQGAAPRLLPTGTVNFEAADSFTPSTAACQLTQTSYSPGIASCEVSFNVPAGFPIGTKFPISASYDGDTNLNPSSTSHKMIISSCVGDSSKPCAGALALGITEPAIIKNALKAIIGCGGTSAKSATLTVNKRKESFPTGSCSVSADLEADLLEIVGNLDAGEFEVLADSITAKDAAADPVLKKIKEMGDLPAAQLQEMIDNSLKRAKLLIEADKLSYNKKVLGSAYGKVNVDDLIKQSRKVTSKASSAKTVLISFGRGQSAIKIGTQKEVKVALNKRAQRYVAIFKKAGIKSISARLKVSFIKKGARPKLKTLTSNNQVLGLN